MSREVVSAKERREGAAPRASGCRFCATPLPEPFLDLGMIPLVNSYRTPAELHRAEPFYPLRVHLCPSCRLVQLGAVVSPKEMFETYAYFSSYSESWLRHARDYCAEMTARLGLDRHHRVVEIASNDGYLLQYFVGRGIPVLGIEPARNVAAAAREKDIPTVSEFFGQELARRLIAEGPPADLVIANNVFGHVPDLNDFVRGLKLILAPGGLITVEVPHLLRLIEERQFDTIYHEHLSYFSLSAAAPIFAAYGLKVVDIDEIPTHGGSVRFHVRHARGPDGGSGNGRVSALARRESEAGLLGEDRYRVFADEVREAKRSFLECLIRLKRKGLSIAAYGAAAKGTVLLNYCGVRSDFIDYTVDRSPHKQGRYLPGTLIPIEDPARIEETKPDVLLILPWNLQEEIMEQMSVIRQWGGRFLVPSPEVRIHD